MPAAHRAAFRDHPVELEVPRVARQRGALLERVAEADQARGPGRACEGAVVVATASPHPRPGQIPGQQRYDGDGARYVRRLDLVAEGLRNAQGAGLEVCPASVLGKGHRLPDQAGKVDAFPGRERRRQQRPGGQLVVGGDVRDQRAGGGESREALDMTNDGLLGRAQCGDGERPPSAAHLLPDCSLRAVHPQSSVGSGRAPLGRFCQVTRSNCTARGADNANTLPFA